MEPCLSLPETYFTQEIITFNSLFKNKKKTFLREERFLTKYKTNYKLCVPILVQLPLLTTTPVMLIAAYGATGVTVRS